MKRSRLFPAFVISTVFVAMISCNLLTSEAVPAEADPVEEDITGEEGSSTALPSDSDSDSCLEGYWWMDNAELDLLVASVVPMPNLRVHDGVVSMGFRSDGTFFYNGSLALRIDMDPAAGAYMEGIGVFNRRGTYTNQGETILFEESESTPEILTWRAYANGRSSEVPGGGPALSLIPEGPAPYRCTDATLEIDTRGPAGTVTMFFTRFIPTIP